MNDYGRICLADWRAVLYDHQGRPPTPHTPIPLTLAPIIFPPPPMGPYGRGGVGKPGSLSIELCLAGSSSTAKAHRSLQNRLDGVNKTFAARGNDIKPNTKSRTRCSINSAIYYQRRKLLHATSSILRDPRLAFPDASSGCAYSVTTKFCACGSDWTHACNHTLSSLSTTTFSSLLAEYLYCGRGAARPDTQGRHQTHTRPRQSCDVYADAVPRLASAHSPASLATIDV